jgi:hypothetical protein
MITWLEKEKRPALEIRVATPDIEQLERLWPTLTTPGPDGRAPVTFTREQNPDTLAQRIRAHKYRARLKRAGLNSNGQPYKTGVKI